MCYFKKREFSSPQCGSGFTLTVHVIKIKMNHPEGPSQPAAQSSVVETSDGDELALI